MGGWSSPHAWIKPQDHRFFRVDPVLGALSNCLCQCFTAMMNRHFPYCAGFGINVPIASMPQCSIEFSLMGTSQVCFVAWFHDKGMRQCIFPHMLHTPALRRCSYSINIMMERLIPFSGNWVTVYTKPEMFLHILKQKIMMSWQELMQFQEHGKMEGPWEEWETTANTNSDFMHDSQYDIIQVLWMNEGRWVPTVRFVNITLFTVLSLSSSVHTEKPFILQTVCFM